MYSLENAVDQAFNILNRDPTQKQQADLYRDLSRGLLTVDHFFERQEQLDHDMARQGQKFSWKKLKVANQEVYTHEKRHQDVWIKYGVKTCLFRLKINPKMYYVLDLNFSTVVSREQYDIAKIIDIYKEMLSASFRKQKHIGVSFLMDIFFYEILSGLRMFDNQSITTAFKKYQWQ